MPTWTPPDTIHLSSSDISNVVDGLHNPASRDAALAFVDTLQDDGYVYCVVCEVAYRRHRPRPAVAGGDTYRALIRELTAVA